MFFLNIKCANNVLNTWEELTGKYCSKQVYEYVGLWKLIIVTFYILKKEYYEIVNEAHPLSGFFPTHADLFTEMHF